MKSKKRTSIVVMTLFAALAMPVGMAAQDNSSQDHKPKHHTYKVIEIGTFGGTSSTFLGVPKPINKRQVATGNAETNIPDPNAPNCFNSECLVAHTFIWQEGVLTDIGALPGTNTSLPNSINSKGTVVGLSENGEIDPITGLPEYVAVVWEKGGIINLGTFGGNWSYANDINDRGRVVGFALNAVPDSYNLGNFCMNGPFPTQLRAFISQDGQGIQDLGTLGGPDSCALWVNKTGQVAGNSFTNSTPNPITGIPTLDPFLWDEGEMVDLGTLGGNLGVTNGLNDRGEVIGQSNLAGDLTFHPFRWSRGAMTDLGTLGGNNGLANWINSAGDVVGKADLPGSQTHDAFLWRNGTITDLGTVSGDKCTNAYSINSQRQVVGCSSDCINCQHAFLWENGEPIVDLNTLIPPGSGLTLTEATYVSDKGEIAAQGVFPSGAARAVLLIPNGDCDDDCEGRIVASRNSAISVKNAPVMTGGNETPISPLAHVRSQLRQRYHLPGQPMAPRD
jgi:probable HAF family extracellular repeat protein